MRVCIVSLFPALASAEQETGEPNVVVKAGSDETEHDQFTELGEYGQPAWAERNRASSTTSVYVLSPYEAFAGVNWEMDFPRHGKLMQELTQEFDFGLLHRFELGVENELGILGNDGHETSVTLEARYALANWNAIALNPAISVEYIFGVGKSVQTARENGRKLRKQPNAVALRLLLGQALFDNRVGYGLNISLQQDVTRDSGREFQLSQSLMYGVMKGTFEAGADMRYTHNTTQSPRGLGDELLLGPTFGWKPTRQTRLSVAPLFGITPESPAVATFVLFSYEFGGAEAIVAPISGDSR
jgi:hypothetical protein